MKVRVWIFVLLFLGMFGVLGKEVSAKGKEERLPDGRLLLERSSLGTMVKVGDEIYFSTFFAKGIYSIKKEKVIEQKSKLGFGNLSYSKGYFFSLKPYSAPCNMAEEAHPIYRYTKRGKKDKKFSLASEFIVTDKYIYYIGAKNIRENEDGHKIFDSDGIYRMDLDGKNKIKLSGDDGFLCKNNNTVFLYKKNNQSNREEIFTLDGKKVNTKFYLNNNGSSWNIPSDISFYSKKTKKMVRVKGSALQTGTYVNGKWKYKTIKKFKKIDDDESIKGIFGTDKYVAVIVRKKDFMEGDLHLYNINGKFLGILAKRFWWAVC